jgi:hypothetical protein
MIVSLYDYVSPRKGADLPLYKKIGGIMPHNNTYYPVREFVKSFCDEIGLDPHYERPKGCWDKKNKCAFISSQSQGIASSPLVVSEIRSTIKVEEKTENTPSINFLKKLQSEGINYISIDGKHRRVCLKEFVNNKFAFTGILHDLEGRSQHFNHKHFKDIPHSFQLAFLQTTVVITEFRDITRIACSTIARNLNDGSPFTAQQSRNTHPTQISSITMDFHNAFGPVINQMYSEKQIAKMQPEETLAKLHMHIADSQSKLSPKTMDKYYENGVGENSDHYDISATSMLKSVLEEINTIYSYNKECLRGEASDLFIYMLILGILQEDIKIQDYKNLISKAMSLNKQLIHESKGRYYDAYNLDSNVIELDFYHEQARLNWGPRRSDRFKALVKALVNKERNLFQLPQLAAAK